MTIFSKYFPALGKTDHPGVTRVSLASAVSGEWETWRRDAGDAGAFEKTEESRVPRAERERAAFAWPTGDTITVPIWIEDGGEAEKMIALELELRGLTRTGDTPAFSFDEILHENDRRLFAVHLLRDARTACAFPGAKWCDTSVRWLSTGENALHLWVENGSVCYALTRGKHVVYAESLRTSEPAESDFQAIRRVIQRLQIEGVLPQNLSSAIIFDPAPPALEAHARKILALKVEFRSERAPNAPATRHDLASLDVAIARQKSRTGKRVRLTAVGGAVFLLLVGLIAGFRFYRDIAEVRSLEARIASEAGEVDRLLAMANDWQAVETAVDSRFYPIDILRDCAAQLPPAGARLTAFSVDAGVVAMQGEAENHPAAFSFTENVRKSPTLVQYNWEIPQPSLLPNNTASFQLRGTRRTP